MALHQGWPPGIATVTESSFVMALGLADFVLESNGCPFVIVFSIWKICPSLAKSKTVKEDKMKAVHVLSIAGISLFSAQSTFAAPTLSTDNGTTIGSMTTPKNYGNTYSGFWRSGAPDYSLLTNTSDTFVNAPGTSGTIHFRRNNQGASGQTTATDLMSIEPSGEIDITSTGSYVINAHSTGGLNDTPLLNSVGVQGDVGREHSNPEDPE